VSPILHSEVALLRQPHLPIMVDLPPWILSPISFAYCLNKSSSACGNSTFRYVVGFDRKLGFSLQEQGCCLVYSSAAGVALSSDSRGGSCYESVLIGEGMIAGLSTALSGLDSAICSSQHRDDIRDWHFVRRFTPCL
jgi:hypothetical protein